MNMFREVFLWLAIFSAFFSIICMAISFGQYFARKSKIFEQYITKGWVARNFDTTALLVSVFLLIVFFYLSSWDSAVREFIKEHTLLVGALLGFPILIKRVTEMQEQTRISREQLRFSQFADAYGKLWSSDLGTRMATIESLWHFAQKHPQEQYSGVMDAFTRFIKHPASYEWEKGTKEEDKKAGKRTDIAAILRHMGEERMAEAKPYEIDLSGVHLEGADFRWSQLEEANLQEAHLQGANLEGARLEGARLFRADLKGANLGGAYLQGAYLDESHLERAHLGSARLQGANLAAAHLEGADLIGARLERASLWRSQLEGAVLFAARLEGVNLGHAHLEGANLRYVNLEGADFHGAHLTLAIINDVDFAGAKNLTQEQIDECVFITNYTLCKQSPKLPDGIEHEYRTMSLKDWERACKERERESATAFDTPF